MLGDVEMEGKSVTSQYFYNFTTNINLSLLYLPVSSKGGKQRHTRVYGPSPHMQWGNKRKREKYLNAEDQLHTCGHSRVNTISDGWWDVILTQVFITQLRRGCPHTDETARPHCQYSWESGLGKKVAQ